MVYGMSFFGKPRLRNIFLNRTVLRRTAVLSLSASLLAVSAFAGIPRQSAEPQLRVLIQPQAAVDAGAKWRLTGWGAWYDSGEILEVPYGEIVIEFRDTDSGDWVTPAAATLTVSEGKLYSHTGAYSLPYGELTVTIQPEEAREAGATWQVDETGPLYASGETVRVNAGRHDIDFSPVRGLARPLLSVDVAAGQSVRRSVSYFPLTVGRVRIKADNIQVTGNHFKASGNVRLAFPEENSGPDTGIITLTGTAFGTIFPPLIQSNGSVAVARNEYKIPIFGKIGFYTGNFMLNGNSLKASGPNHVPGVEFLGLDMVVRSFRFHLNPFGVSMSCFLDLDDAVFGLGGRLDVRKLLLISGETVPAVDYTISTDGYNIFDFMACEGVSCTGNAFTNTIDCHVDSIIIPYIPSIEGDLLVKDGTLKKLDAQMVGADKQIKDTPFYLQDVTLKLRNVNTRQGSVRIGLAGTLLPKNCALAGADMDMDIDFTGYAEGTGSISVLGHKTSEGNFTLYVPAYVMGDFYHNVLFGLRKLTGNFTAFWSNGRLNSYLGSGRGTVGFSPPDWAVPLLGQLVADDGYVYVLDTFVQVGTGGFTARVKLLNLINLGFFLPPDWIGGTDGSSMRSLENDSLSKVSVGGATAANGSFKVPAEAPGVVFSGVGGKDVPVLALIRPDGARIDPAGSLPGNSRDFIYRSDPRTRSTAVLVRSPMPGFWTVEVTNPNTAGETELYFYEGNHSPRIKPIELEKISDQNFRLIFKSFDPDDEAEVAFFLDENSWGFDGVPIGSCLESDGRSVYTWRPGALPFKSGYVYAVVDDGSNAREAAYFDEKAFVVESFIPPPELKECLSRGNSLILKLDLPNPQAVDHVRVYFTDDLEQEELHKWINVQTDSVIRIKGGPIKPGRRYRIAVSAVDRGGAETRLSRARNVKYEAGSVNNHPFFTSSPDPQALAGSSYACMFQAVDWDGDPLSFALKDGPETMTLDTESNKLLWNPGIQDLGRNRVILTADDGRGGTDDQTFYIQVDSPENSSTQVDAEWISGAGEPHLFLQVVDHMANRDSSCFENLEVGLSDEYGAEYARVPLHETSARSGIFQGLLSSEEITYPLRILMEASDGRSRGREITFQWETGRRLTRRRKAYLISR